MPKSMTGYGKAECLYHNKQIVVEIKSVNSKTLDVNLRFPTIYRENESEIRGLLNKVVQRGKVDVFISLEAQNGKAAIEINAGIFKAYFAQLHGIMGELHIEPDKNNMVSAILRMPDVLKQPVEQLDEGEWQAIMTCFVQALGAFEDFREQEGKMIMQDIVQRITCIGTLLHQVDEYEPCRLDTVRQRVLAGIEGLQLEYDQNRFEQELIYYIEKFDVTEEKVRLKQHGQYFLDTAGEEASGRKLGFIAQEIGREVNTLGSKANHAGIQKIVVQMKDELEKVKEQLLNVL
ncbi:MAG: YicC family protein [Prevotellaceae bacterium]|jgi:uncharacterized protein (TIGR00255 family)|nr:YicC family protein [Prevotellaceae bacterium]